MAFGSQRDGRQRADVGIFVAAVSAHVEGEFFAFPDASHFSSSTYPCLCLPLFSILFILMEKEKGVETIVLEKRKMVLHGNHEEVKR
jgi:hypothetical protein